MKSHFDLFRLSLLVRTTRSLFAEESEPTREQYLRRVFGVQQTFDHYKNRFVYRPETTADPTGPVLGRIGRPVEIEENLSPDEGFEEVSHLGWKAAVVVLDPTDRADQRDGQKLAVEVDKQVGGPLPLIQALVTRINEANPDAPFFIEAQPIFDAASFWAWAENTADVVTSVTFDLVAPNGFFNTNNDTKEELKAAKAQTNANEVSISLRNSEGLETNSEPIRDAVEYAENSGGRIRAKAKNGKRFSSTRRPVTTTIQEDASSSEPLIVRAARKVAEILGR